MAALKRLRSGRSKLVWNASRQTTSIWCSIMKSFASMIPIAYLRRAEPWKPFWRPRKRARFATSDSPVTKIRTFICICHIQMNVRIFVTGESDVANLARFLGLQNGFHGSALRKYAIRIIEANDFMMLYQIDMVCLEAFQTCFDLPPSNLFSAAINFCHQKYLLTISVFQGLTHPHFTLAFVVVPTVIHERNAAINGGAHQADALVVGEPMLRNMEPTHPNGGDPLSGASERTVKHVALSGSCR